MFSPDAIAERVKRAADAIEAKAARSGMVLSALTRAQVALGALVHDQSSGMPTSDLKGASSVTGGKDDDATDNKDGKTHEMIWRCAHCRTYVKGATGMMTKCMFGCILHFCGKECQFKNRLVHIKQCARRQLPQNDKNTTHEATVILECVKKSFQKQFSDAKSPLYKWIDWYQHVGSHKHRRCFTITHIRPSDVLAAAVQHVGQATGNEKHAILERKSKKLIVVAQNAIDADFNGLWSALWAKATQMTLCGCWDPLTCTICRIPAETTHGALAFNSERKLPEEVTSRPATVHIDLGALVHHKVEINEKEYERYAKDPTIDPHHNHKMNLPVFSSPPTKDASAQKVGWLGVDIINTLFSIQTDSSLVPIIATHF